MVVRTFKRIGTHHVNNCEDAVGKYEIGQNRIIALVADGCSMGNEAYFASELFSKIIRNLAKSEFYKEFASKYRKPVSVLLRDVIEQLHQTLNSIRQVAGLQQEDLLTTLVMAIVDGESQECAYIVIGDGLVVIDDVVQEFDQGNQPDYLAYHLSKNFDEWFDTLNTVCTKKVGSYISLATDGIFTFADEMDKRIEDQDAAIIIHQLLQSADTKSPNDLQNKVDRIENEKSLRPTDDLGLVKIILDS